MQKTKYDGIYKQKEGVLLNMDNEALKQYKLRKRKERKIREMEEDLHHLKEDINHLKQNFGDIKDLLMILVNDKGRQKDS